jgi:hypothetical protein
MVRFGVMLASLLLAGCGMIGWPKPSPETAATASAWTQPGAGEAATATAYQQCLDTANIATQTDFAIDQDTAATRSSDLQHSEFAQTQMQNTQDTNRDRAQSILSACMEGKGFNPVK